MTTYAIAGNIIGRKAQNGGNGKGWQEDVMYTLDTIGTFAVVTDFDGGGYSVDDDSDMLPIDVLRCQRTAKGQTERRTVCDGGRADRADDKHEPQRRTGHSGRDR